jgi:transcription initiation factor TFIIB
MWGIYENVLDSIESVPTKPEENISTKRKSKKIKIKIKVKHGDKNVDCKKNTDGKKNTDKSAKGELCEFCHKNSLIFDENVVCTSCGMINSIIINQSQEWRYYGSEDSKRSSDPNRCGMPINPLLPNSSLGTIINGRGFEVYRRLHKWNSITYKERSLIKVFNTITAKAKEGTIPNCIIDKASLMYKMLSENNIKRGSSRQSLIAACLWNALKSKDLSRSTKEIAKLFDINIKKMTVGCKEFNEKMHLKDINYSTNIKPATAENYIDRYSVKLKIPVQYKNNIVKVAVMSEKLGIVTKNTPQSIAVGSIYLVSQEYNLGFTKKILHNICEISEVTISKAYKELEKYKKYLIK